MFGQILNPPRNF